MKRLVGIILSFLFVVGIAVGESVVSKHYINETMESVTLLVENATQDNFYSDDNILIVQKLKNDWEDHKNFLSYMTNHKDIKEVGEQITLLSCSQNNKDYDAFVNSVNLIIYYIDSYNYIFGVNIQNII